jgi:hypothetical protein
LYLNSLKIHNLRCFEEATLELQYPGRKNGAERFPNINVLLGNNGAGKSTVLKAIALATLSPVITQSGYVPYHLIRRTHLKESLPREAKISASVILHDQDADLPKKNSPRRNISLLVTRMGDSDFEVLEGKHYSPSSQKGAELWQNMYDDKSPSFFVVGYGATRSVEEAENYKPQELQKARRLRYQRVAGLFENMITLTPLYPWLLQLERDNKGRYTQVVALINKLLPEGAKLTSRFLKNEYLFSIGKAEVPFSALSDGYRAFIGWVADLLYHLCNSCPPGKRLVEIRGIVLVDEIDLHLHPEWQRWVVPRISAYLPNLQFVFSTHSPIVTSSVMKENVFVMEADPLGVSSIEQYDERTYGLTAEQMLLSSYFNLTTTRGEPFEDELEELSIRARGGDIDAALAFMLKASGEESVGRQRNKRSGGKKSRKFKNGG